MLIVLFEGKSQLSVPKQRWEGNIKIDLKHILVNVLARLMYIE